MKTLVIHPDDRSTDFLKAIYEGKDFTVVNTEVSRRQMKELVKSHDRIIMLGHGDENGLYGFGDYVVNQRLVFHLRNKPECIYVWCYASSFMKKYGLKGFGTGMFISEYEEAMLMCIEPNQAQIERSNDLFSKVLNEEVDQPVEKIYQHVMEKYNEEGSQTVEYNSFRLCLK